MKRGTLYQDMLNVITNSIMNTEQKYETLVNEIRRRKSIVKERLIGQSLDDLSRHYALIGMQDAFNGLLSFIEAIDDGDVSKSK